MTALRVCNDGLRVFDIGLRECVVVDVGFDFDMDLISVLDCDFVVAVLHGCT